MAEAGSEQATDLERVVARMVERIVGEQRTVPETQGTLDIKDR